MRSNYLLFLFAFCSPLLFFGQRSARMDSILNSNAKYTDQIIFLRQKFPEQELELAVRSESNEKIKVKLYNAICWKYFTSSPLKALDYAKLQLDLALKLKDTDAIEAGYDNYGFLYENFGEFEKSIDYLLKSLKIKEDKKDTSGIAVCMNGIGALYYTMQNFPKAIEYYLMEMHTDSLLGAKDNIANACSNVGVCYDGMNQYAQSLRYYQLAERLYKELKVDPSSSLILNMGTAYLRKGASQDLTRAEEYLKKAFEIAKREKDLPAMVSANISLGELYSQKKDHKKAVKYEEEALLAAKQNKLIEYEIQAMKSLATIYSECGDFRKAFEYQQLFSNLKDTLLTEKNSRAITEMNTKYETEKKEKQLEIQDLTLNQNKLELKKRQIIIYATASGILLMITLSFFIFWGYKQKKEANIELTEKNFIIEEKSRIVEEQHKDIIDSINYAKRIQQAILAEEEHISDHLPPHFIFFKPKDIVSGDFYWAFEKGDYLYVTAADCTGHGVPGAFLTMLGISYLNEINSKEEVLTPAEILNQLRDKILKELSRHGTTKDGMDISLIRMNLKTSEVMWAGAFNPLWYTDNGVLKEIKANKQPIGYAEDLLPFTNHTLNLMPTDTVYLFTDGFADQFGGPAGKKYKYKQMEQVLMSNRNKPFEEQKNILRRSFEDWKGSLEQVDDVTVIAIQVSAV